MGKFGVYCLFEESAPRPEGFTKTAAAPVLRAVPAFRRSCSARKRKLVRAHTFHREHPFLFPGARVSRTTAGGLSLRARAACRNGMPDRPCGRLPLFRPALQRDSMPADAGIRFIRVYSAGFSATRPASRKSVICFSVSDGWLLNTAESSEICGAFLRMSASVCFWRGWRAKISALRKACCRSGLLNIRGGGLQDVIAWLRQSMCLHAQSGVDLPGAAAMEAGSVQARRIQDFRFAWAM